MNIEEYIDRLANNGSYLFYDAIPVFQSDASIISSFAQQSLMLNGYTEKQSLLAVRLVKKYAHLLQKAFGASVVDVIHDTSNPTFRLPIRVLNTARTIMIDTVGDKKVISVSFPYNEETITLIKTYRRGFMLKSDVTEIKWNSDRKCWEFDLREDHIDWISTHLLDSSFLTGEDFLEFVRQINEVKENFEKYIPAVVFEDNKFKYINVPATVPQPTDYDLVNIMIRARKYGITTWSEDIDTVLRELNLEPHLHNFLTSPVATTLSVEKEKLTFSNIGSIIKCSLPCLVVVPGGSELKHLKACLRLLQAQGIANDEMTVLFRLDKEAGKACNEFVKTEQLNSPLGPNTKVAFISGKVPKPLVESKIDFSTVLNLGISGVHYTLSNYLRNHHFVISYTMKEADFAIM